MVTKLESNNWGKEKKDYIKEALEYTGKELSQLQRASFVERVNANSWRYKLDTVVTYLEGIRNDYSYLNLSKNKNTTVMATQIALYKAWYMWVWHIDAKWWPDTRSYIKKFQADNNLPISWFLTKRTVDKLIAVAEEKQGIKREKKPETKEKDPKKPTTPVKPNPTKPTPSKPNPSLDNPVKTPELLSQTDTTTIKKAIQNIWWFDQYKQFIVKNGKEIQKGGKKYLQILWTEYEEYPTGLSNIDNSTSKNWYHNANDYFIFWKFINWECYDWVKISWYDWVIIEKWQFNPHMNDSIEKGERIYEDWRVEKWTFASSADWALEQWTRKSSNGQVTNL